MRFEQLWSPTSLERDTMAGLRACAAWLVSAWLARISLWIDCSNNLGGCQSWSRIKCERWFGRRMMLRSGRLLWIARRSLPGLDVLIGVCGLICLYESAYRAPFIKKINLFISFFEFELEVWTFFIIKFWTVNWI